jgi:DNA replication and repair protein RecF
MQRYQRVIVQRNHLLKSVRGGRTQPDELGFWDDELVGTGKYIMARRARTIKDLSEKAAPIHGDLSGNGEVLELAYRPSVETPQDASEDEVALSLRDALAENRPRELAQGFTALGPHRDDVTVRLDGMEAGPYASRGQCRTAVLAMKLAEAGSLSDERGQEPVLLLDDLLSELDAERRAYVLGWVGRYQQTFITTADAGIIDDRFLSQMARYEVRGGGVGRPQGPSAGPA